MKKIFMILLAMQICLSGISVGNASAASENIIEHVHEWEETTETVHHDAEYTTKTTWIRFGRWLASMSKGTIPEGPNKYHINYTDEFGTYTDEYDIYCWYYGSLENIPQEYIRSWITIDNYEEYDLTYDEFCSETTVYDLWGNKNPEFNPEYDTLICFNAGLMTEVYYGENGIKDNKLTKNYYEQNKGIPQSDGSIRYFYLPAAQEQICVNEAYDETIVHHVCTVCGESYETIEETFKGDVNCDGSFNVADVVLLQKWLLGAPDVKLDDWKAADLCKDGRLDVFDLCLMKRMLINNGK